MNKDWYYKRAEKCVKPIFSPKDELHRNCYTKVLKSWMYKIPILPIDDSPYKAVEDGYWKRFHPNHKIKEEGNYKKGVKIGKFKHYDENGNLVEIKNHITGYLKIYKWWIFLFIIFILTVFLVKKKLKQNNS